MKKLILPITTALLLSLSSCEKNGEHGLNLFDKNEKECPTVSAESLPENVKTSFKTKYVDANLITWYDKDGTSYCAIFTTKGTNTKASFDKNGTFISEETEGNENDNNESGCECELDDKD